MSNIVLKAEFLAGTNVKDAVREAKEMAIKLDVAFIRFDFNGVRFSISQRADIDAVAEGWIESKGSVVA